MVDEAYRALLQSKTPLYRETFEADVFDQVAVSIYQSASETTLPLYDLMGGQDHNWVNRWLLWHVMTPTPREFSDTASGVTRWTESRSDETTVEALTPLTPWSPPPHGRVAEMLLPLSRLDNTGTLSG